MSFPAKLQRERRDAEAVRHGFRKNRARIRVQKYRPIKMRYHAEINLQVPSGEKSEENEPLAPALRILVLRRITLRWDDRYYGIREF